VSIFEEYVENHKKCGIKVGDFVKILRTAETEEAGWDNAWVEEMDDSGGHKFGVLSDCKGHGFCLEDGQVNYKYPYFVLEKVVKDER